jgi:predicted phage baseplate assembly protein
MPSDVQEDFAPAGYTGDEWPGFELPSSGDPVVQLDAYYPKVLPKSWLVFAGPNYTELYRAETVEPSARADFGIASKTTRILFDAGEHLSWFGLRSTVVHAESEELEMADEPIAIGVPKRMVSIRPAVTPPVPGQYLVFTGRPSGAGPDADRVSEIAVVDLVTPGTDETTIRLAADLQNTFDSQDLRVCANVAPATHGETVEAEVLGGGAAAVAFQRFALKKSPLTFVSAQTPSGVASTLTLRVNGVAWDEAASLSGAGPRDQHYVVRLDDEQRTALVFGDGRSGARLPTGQENVTATYRSGLGPDGNLDADTLTLLQTRPLGIRGVTNPVASGGGAAPERLDDARTNAPLTVLTLDRIVSLRDFEDFARAFAGIVKAQATALWAGDRFTAHVTIAGPDGAEVSEDSLLFGNLLDAIGSIRDPSVRFQVASYRARSFLVSARVLADERLEPVSVFERVVTALRAEFSFDRRSFAQPVTSAEVITAIQGIEGVVASNLAALYAFDPASPPPTEFVPPPPEEVLTAERGALAGNLGAELLLVDPARISVEAMVP